MYPVEGVCDFLKLPISLLVSAKGGRHMAATSEYKSNVCAAVYLFKIKQKIIKKTAMRNLFMFEKLTTSIKLKNEDLLRRNTYLGWHVIL